MTQKTDKRETILLIDDSEFSLAQAAKILGDSYELLRAVNGAEGLVKLESNKVDLVITDLLMPHISGLAFLGLVRQRFPQTKVIVCSADIQAATASKARELGAAAFIPKPLDPDELRRVVRLALGQEKRPSDPRITPHHLDAFKEMFNIGTGRAANALSKLVYDTVKLSVPRVEVLRPNQLVNHVIDSFNEDIAYVRQGFDGTVSGTACLLLTAQSGVSLVNALLRQPGGTNETISEGDQDMLVEVGNILINSLVGSIANSLGIDFHFARARCDVGAPLAICSDLQLDNPEYVMYVETLFVVPGRNIGGNFVILLGTASMGELLKGIDKLF